MNDKKMVRKCADAMGLAVWEWVGMPGQWSLMWSEPVVVYDPLKSDAQAMALVERFKLSIDQHFDGRTATFVMGWDANAKSMDLKRAIVKCVASLGREGLNK